MTDQELHKALYGIDSINNKQRDILKETLEKHKGAGPMNKFKFDRFLKEIKQNPPEGLSTFEARKAHAELSKFRNEEFEPQAEESQEESNDNETQQAA